MCVLTCTQSNEVLTSLETLQRQASSNGRKYLSALNETLSGGEREREREREEIIIKDPQVCIVTLIPH